VEELAIEDEDRRGEHEVEDTWVARSPLHAMGHTLGQYFLLRSY
jgi:hypothetical protein